ncbi:MAG: DNA-protecting protein DprA [Lysobacteraceae bacterium]|nr:MAG: DNA-protecting protein DprA [Xanthomonadaceae bacterium]
MTDDDTPLSAETDALLRLVLAGGAAAPRRRLIEAHGGPLAAELAGVAAWRACGLDSDQVRALHPATDGSASALRKRCRDWLRLPTHHLIGWHDRDYPSLLRQSVNPPLAVFVAGDPALLWHPGIAVVGSRGPSPSGRDNARSFSLALSRAGLSIVSGMAAGVDRAAHEAALEGQRPTVAVLGTGPDVPYPREHAALLTRIATQGAVISEHPPGTTAVRGHFPSRNRIIAALSLGTLVVEAASRSGALITARLAAEAGREVFAIPGSIHNPMTRGCHRLIRDGAALVESPDEIIAELGPMARRMSEHLRQPLPTPIDGPGKTRPQPVSEIFETPFDADADYQRLWRALDDDPTDMDRLVERTGLTAATLSSMLLLMELQGRVVRAHGRYTRARPPHLTAPSGAGQGT